MAEILSPNSKLKGPFSPTKFVLGSNDDKLERAQARAARAAVIRRKPIPVAPPPSADPCLDKEQILELFQNCIKLASENVSFLLVFTWFKVSYMWILIWFYSAVGEILN